MMHNISLLYCYYLWSVSICATLIVGTGVYGLTRPNIRKRISDIFFNWAYPWFFGPVA